jgi:josephin
LFDLIFKIKVYYNLDSKLDQPEHIGNSQNLKAYLTDLLNQKETELFVIVNKDVEQDESWKIKT